MIRWLSVLLLIAPLAPASHGDDPDLELRVKVALALSSASVTGTADLDWCVPGLAPRVEPAPAPKMAPAAKKLAAPAPAPATPTFVLWRMWDASGNSWLEYRPPPPKVMPPAPAPAARPAVLDWRVIRPAMLDPLAPCVGTV